VVGVGVYDTVLGEKFLQDSNPAEQGPTRAVRRPYPTRNFGLVVELYGKAPINIQKLIKKSKNQKK
jgi:hypothetical protein